MFTRLSTFVVLGLMAFAAAYPNPANLRVRLASHHTHDIDAIQCSDRILLWQGDRILSLQRARILLWQRAGIQYAFMVMVMMMEPATRMMLATRIVIATRMMMTTTTTTMTTMMK